MSESLKLGIAGLGTVGTGLLQLLREHGPRLAQSLGRQIEVAGVSARTRDKKRGVSLEGLRWFDTAESLAVDPAIDVFVELIGGDEGTPRRAVEAALKAGKAVVTANKALLARHGSELAELAEKAGVALNFEAAVAGGIPVIKTLREALAGNQIRRVYGILNGTCNYILTQMQEEQRSFDDVLREAQAKGYAEADPTFDIDGFDTAHKLALLTSLAFGTRVAFDEIDVEGIRTITPGRHRGGRRPRLPHQAAGRGADDGERHRAARASGDGAQAFGHRRDLRRHQLRRHRRRLRSATCCWPARAPAPALRPRQ